MSSSSERGPAPPSTARRAARRGVDEVRTRYARATRLHRALARATLVARALPRRRAARADWEKLRANTGAPGDLARTITSIDTSRGRDAAAADADRADADLLCFLAATSDPIGAGWLTRLASALDGRVAAATAQLVHPYRPLARATPYDGRVRELGVGLAVRDDVPVAVARGAGGAVETAGDPVDVEGASGACVLVDRAAYRAAGGLGRSPDVHVAIFDLCRRLRAQGRSVVVVPGAVVADARPVPSVRALTEAIPRDEAPWHGYVDDAGASLLRAAAPLPAGTLRIALTVAAPSAKVAPRWGDWHLAQAFARALGRRGHHVRVQTNDHADDPAGRACDVHCVIRGLAHVRRTRGQAHVLWIISHPEAVDSAECDAADLVLVASHRFADDLRRRTRTPVEVMQQATDTHRFRPLAPDPRHAHDVVVVAKSRDVARAAVADALAAGVRPAIYGSGWEQFVDRDLVVQDYIANEELPLVYASAGVLLNDHWDAMREWGFVSNRLFDALACGTPVISDHMPEIPELFGDAVLTYREPSELGVLVQSVLADPTTARARAARGMRVVREHHTMDHRAGQLIAALGRHGLVPDNDCLR